MLPTRWSREDASEHLSLLPRWSPRRLESKVLTVQRRSPVWLEVRPSRVKRALGPGSVKVRCTPTSPCDDGDVGSSAQLPAGSPPPASMEAALKQRVSRRPELAEKKAAPRQAVVGRWRVAVQCAQRFTLSTWDKPTSGFLMGRPTWQGVEEGRAPAAGFGCGFTPSSSGPDRRSGASGSGGSPGSFTQRPRAPSRELMAISSVQQNANARKPCPP